MSIPDAPAPNFEDYPSLYGWTNENERGYKILERPSSTTRPMRVIHIGAGMSGICLSKMLPDAIKDVTLTCYDKNGDIGGTWLENVYPGCGCDIPSVNYQFTWARNPNWAHFYSYREEIWQYLRDVVDRFDLEKYMKLKHQVLGAEWDDERGVWDVTVKDLTTGNTFVDTAEILINGTGVLNNWQWPEIEGLNDFKGPKFHTAAYDEKFDLTGKRVAVIGIGSSGIQVTAAIAPIVDRIYTWVRSPTWITAGFAGKFAGPNGANFEYTDEQKKKFAEDPVAYMKYCKEIEDELNVRFKFILNNTPHSKEAKEFATNQMRQKLGDRTDIMEKLIPTTFNVGCRRPTPGNGFLEALTRPNVTTFTQGIKKITEKGVVNEDGEENEVDVIICATGFDTTWVPRIPIVARGQNVQDIIRKRLISYLSIGMPDIPNYWGHSMPYAPLGHGSFVPTIEMICKYFISLVKKMQVNDIKSLTPKPEVCEDYIEHADTFLTRTAWSGPCSSWFKKGAGNKLGMFPGSRITFFELLASPRYEDYKIEYRHGNTFAFFGNGFSVTEFNGSDLSWYLGNEENPGHNIPEEAMWNSKKNGKLNGVSNGVQNGIQNGVENGILEH